MLDKSGTSLIKYGQGLENEAYRLAMNRATRTAAGRLLNQGTEMVAAGATIQAGVRIGFKVAGVAALGATVGFTLVGLVARGLCDKYLSQ